MPIITEFELTLLEQPLLNLADQPIYTPPREGSIKIDKILWGPVQRLEIIVAKYANVGTKPKRLDLNRRDDGQPVTDKYHSMGIPFIRARHYADLYADSGSTTRPYIYIATLNFDLPDGKACRMIGDIINGFSLLWWTPEAAAKYNDLPQQCRALIRPNFPRYQPPTRQ